MDGGSALAKPGVHRRELSLVEDPFGVQFERLVELLVDLSEAAHKATASGEADEVKKIEEEVDRVAAKLWELTDEELSEIRSSLMES